MKRGSDPIIWQPRALPVNANMVTLQHPCQQAVLASVTRRDALDPMALDVCRFCGEKMP